MREDRQSSARLTWRSRCGAGQTVGHGVDQLHSIDWFVKDAREPCWVNGAGIAGHDDHGNSHQRWLSGHFGRDVGPMKERKTQIQHHGGGLGLLHHAKCVDAICDRNDGVTGGVQGDAIHLSGLRIVFNDQDNR